MKVKLSQIRTNPIHDQIYTTNEIEDLVESMQKNGMLEPIIVTPEKVIISGHRRFLAATFLGWDEIEVIIREVDQAIMEYTIISSNQHRSKKSAEVLNEIQRLYKSYSNSQQSSAESPFSKAGQHYYDNSRQSESWYW